MEGINFAAILLGYLGLLIFGVATLVSLGLVIGRKAWPALITFATGLLASSGSAALAALSFLQRGLGFHVEGSDPTLVLTALTLLLAGASQFIAAVRCPRAYAITFGFSAAALGLLAAPMLSADFLGSMVGTDVFSRIAGLHSLSMPWINLGLALGLTAAVLSVIAALASADRRTGLLWGVAISVLAGIIGFAAGEACVTTRSTLVRGFPGGGPHEIRVEVDVLGKRVSDETGLARTTGGRLELVRAVTPAQAVWVYAPLAVGAALGIGTALAIGRLVLRHRGQIRTLSQPRSRIFQV